MEELKGERMSRRCWNKFGSESLFAQYSPFFVSLAAGNLSPHAIGKFIYQDRQFLKVIFSAYVEAAKNCVNDDCEKMIIKHLKISAFHRISVYEELVKEWGLEFPEEPTCFVSIDDYRSLLIDTATGKVEGKQVDCNRKIAAYTLGAIVPKMRLYSHLFHQIWTIRDPSHTPHIYNKWIDHYSSQDFEVWLFQNEYLMDKFSHHLTEEEVEVMEKLYHQALKLQIEFFAELPTHMQALVPLFRSQDLGTQLTVFCDFDMTCTITESAAILAGASIAVSEFYQIPSAGLRRKLRVLSNQCSEEFEECLKRIESSVQGQQVFDVDGLLSALEQVAECEMRANERVEELRLLQGLSLDYIELAASIIILQKGCREFFRKIAENKTPNIDVHVISYCWCGDLIRSVLSPEVSIFNVHSNELAYNKGWTTGDIWRRVETSFDKFRFFTEIKKCCKTETEHMTIYIGGDVGDLLCLLAADIGIVVSSSNPNLMRMGHHFGVKFLPLFPALVQKRKFFSKGSSDIWGSDSGILYTVSCWTEIEAFIMGM